MEKFDFRHFRISSLHPWFVTGLSQGEAAFTYSRNGKGFTVFFSIRLRADEKELIEKLYIFFKVGKIYHAKGREPAYRSGLTQPSLYYRTHKISDLDKITKHFDNYPLVGKKANAYKIWKEMALLKRDYKKPDLKKLNDLACQLSSLNSKNRVKVDKHYV